MKVLAIGNSFSLNANKYIFEIAKAQGISIKNVNLFIGGCPMSRHYRNIHAGKDAYSLSVCGHETGINVSIDEALLSDDWDFVTLQQASPESFRWERYEPYLEFLTNHVRELCPAANFCVHETWAYRHDSERFAALGLLGDDDMYEKLRACYRKMYDVSGAEVFIPSGDVFHRAVKEGIEVHSADGSHAGDFGCYILGLTWVAALSKKPVSGNTFRDIQSRADEEQFVLAQKIVDEVVFRESLI